MPSPIFWTDLHIARLREFRAAKWSYGRIATHMGVSRSAVAGAVRRHVAGIPDLRKRRGRRKPDGTEPKLRQQWTESVLTEPWAQRKLRRELERGSSRPTGAMAHETETVK